MGSILNPASDNSFISLVKARDTRIFVDKTSFIARTNALLNTDGKLLAVTRPRRFGKTVTAHMLSAYYSKGYAGRSIFADLAIEEQKGYAEHLNQYNVLYVDMNSIKDRYVSYKADPSLHIGAVDDIVDFLQYLAVRELKEIQEYAALIASDPLIGRKSLSSALEIICRHSSEQFILIMDEWDLIYREYQHESALQEKFIEFLRGLFKADDGVSSFALAYLTGILPIKKDNSQSALNGFDEYNMLTPGDLAPYFGFTDEEVARIVQSPNCRVSHQELREWYEEYRIRGVDIYNPNSVCKAVSRSECISYWSKTSSNEEVVRLINLDFEGIKKDILDLIEGARVQFDFSNFQNDMVNIDDKDDVLSLLVCLGYLGCSDVPGDEDLKLAYVPNKEIRRALMGIIRKQDWYEKMDTIRRSESLLKAILDLDGGTVAALIQEVHNSPAVTLLDYNDEESLTYCVMTGLLWSTLGKYIAHREEQAGKGRADLVYEPAVKGSTPLILIEFKYDASAEEAIQQIKTQEYFRRYTAQYRDVIIAGINYSTKTKDHQCLLERLL